MSGASSSQHYDADSSFFDDEDDPSLRQSAQERRKIRAKYRSLISKAEEDKQKLNSGDNSVDVYESLKHVNELFLKVKAPQDAALDSCALLQLAEISADKIQRMKLDSGSFDIEDFVGKVALKLRGREQMLDAKADGLQTSDNQNDAGKHEHEHEHDLDRGTAEEQFREMQWERLTPQLLRLSNRPLLSGFMYGAIAVQIKQREKRQRTARLVKDPSKLRRPEELQEDDIVQQENETSASVQMLYTLLNTVEPIPFFRFILNPNSFSQSVENLFHLSFLIRDGLASLEQDDNDGELMLSTDSEPTEQDIQEGTVKIQQIMNFDMNMWEDAVKAYGIVDSIIPHRKPVSNRNDDGKWYG
eukprot:jgi/Hompol1/2237/HPOL_002159-RA